MPRAPLNSIRRFFGATEMVRLADPSGKVIHTELRIGNANTMLADEFPDMGYRSPDALGGSPVSMLLYVADVDAFVAKAIVGGAKESMAVADQFDGDRRGTLNGSVRARMAARHQPKNAIATRIAGPVCEIYEGRRRIASRSNRARVIRAPA
jgi:uncharacterized glyoxalase superfamily protein PhnB